MDSPERNESGASYRSSRRSLRYSAKTLSARACTAPPNVGRRPWLTYTQGTAASPEDHLRVIFKMDDDDYPVGSDDMIIVDNIHFMSTCEHHMAPFRGTAHVAYIPNPESRIVTGLSKISRVVTLFARRLQIQERMTQQIARTIDDHLEPLGVIAVVQAAHFCMIQRGVEQRESTTITTARRGVFLTKPQLETRFLEYLRMQDGKPDIL